jgi:hypothetical protein
VQGSGSDELVVGLGQGGEFGSGQWAERSRAQNGQTGFYSVINRMGLQAGLNRG